MVKLPEGLKFPGGGGGRNKGRQYYRVGRCLGIGAQGTVHAIIDNTGREQPYVAKLARHPVKKAGLKKKKSVDEINIGSLYAEYQYYQFHFRDFRTTCSPPIIPNLPPTRDDDIPAYGEIVCSDNGPDFRFLTIERMDAPFFSMVDTLVNDATANININIGPICVRMIEILQLFHDKGYVFVDCKSDNFMLATSTAASAKKKSSSNKKKKSSATATAEELASRIRWLDLAMVQRLQDIYGMKINNEKSSKVQGTPLYCSLHVHEYNKPSRRDDLFAIGLVLSELIIRIQSLASGTDNQYTNTTNPQQPSYLPWANERSDDDVGKVKRDQVLNRNSTFYQRMSCQKTADIMYQFLGDANDLEFKKKPQYSDYISMVSNLQVVVPAVGSATMKKKKTTRTAAAAASAKATCPSTTRSSARTKGKTVPYTAEFAAAANKKKSTTTTATRQTRRSGRLKRDHDEDSDDDDDDVSPPRTKKASKSFHAEVDDANMEYISSDDDEDDDKDDGDEVVPMDIDDDEEVEVKKPAAAAKKKKKKDDCGIKLSVVQGPDKGKSIIILKPGGGGGRGGATTTTNNKPKDIVVGTKPTNTRKNEVAFQLSADKTIGKSHVKLKGIFGSREPSCSVEVTDLSSGNGTYLDGKLLASGGKKTVHRCGTIRLGSTTTIQVSWWSGSSDKENVA